jgi:molecular chaperone GrpE (heat shock protein)
MKKIVIAGLLLLVTGVVVFEWVFAQKRAEQKQTAYYKSKHDAELIEHLKRYKQWLQIPAQERTQLTFSLDKSVQTKTKEQLLQEQQERLKADLDKLAAGEMDAYPYADVLYGQSWQSEVSKYIKQREQREFFLTSSIVLISVGGMILVVCFLTWTARLVIKGLSRLRKLLANVFAKHSPDQPAKIDKKSDKQSQSIPLTQLLGLKDVSCNNSRTDIRHQLNRGQKKNEPPSLAGNSARDKKSVSSLLEGDDIDLMISGEKTIESEETLAKAIEAANKNTIQLADSLKSQVENLEKQVEEIKQIAGDRQEKIEMPPSSENPAPLNDTLDELRQEVAAIREYASNQQDRIKKLQEGYDLNIIKNFCLRVIRCVDNVESCIQSHSEQDNELEHLKEVRDELLFALESSGVEQFEPEISSDYRGQEKLVEAVKEKEICDDPTMTGKVAEVVKPGYQYFIDEENMKVVRPAMVKLFG